MGADEHSKPKDHDGEAHAVSLRYTVRSYFP
jgi:hypothetical protein